MRLRVILCLIWLVVAPLVLLINFQRLNSLGATHTLPAAEEKHVPEVKTLTAKQRPKAGQDAVGCPRGASTQGCGKYRCCWQIHGDKIHAVLTDDPWPQWVSFEALDNLGFGSAEKALPLQGSPLFLLFHEDDAGFKPAPLGTDNCEVKSSAQDTPLSLRFVFHCGPSVAVEYFAHLADASSHYLRIQVKVWARDSSTWPAKGFSQLRLFQLNGEVQAKAARVVDNSELMMDPIDGVPILIQDRFFLGVEHPMAVHQARTKAINATHWDGAAGDITHLAKLKQPTEQLPWQYGTVFGVYSESSQARRAFVTYIHNERPGRRTPMVHYNSWYDFFSYQDEGFNGGFNDPNKDEAMISQLRLDPMQESSCLQRVNAFGTELVQKRNATIDSFLWDDGWDDPQTLWEFDKKRFPQRFDVVAAKAASYGSGTGVWLSPWGGYGYPQENRVKYGKQFGYETNVNQRLETEAFSLAGPKYRKTFIDTATRFVREDGVNMFKFDGVAGDPRELAVEMEAMLGMCKDLRVATTSRNAKRKHIANKEDSEKDKDSIWINLTTGTWASPFFLFFADSIWRGGPDIASRVRDWEPDGQYFQVARRTGKPVDDGLSRRQRWIRWRALIVYVLVVRQSLFFPISQLMIHGVVLASHGDALHWGLDKFDPIDFAQEVWSFLGLGLQLQELYLAPRHMTPESWDILAEGLQWARREVHVLRDSHWAFGDPTRRETYCTASWDIAAARGFIMLHNPTGEVQNSAPFSLLNVLELPTASSALRLNVSTVKSIARGGPLGVGQDVWTSRIKDVKSDSFGASSCQKAGWCTIAPLSDMVIQMSPSEVLVLAVNVAA